MSHKEEAEDQSDHPSDLDEFIICKKDHAAKCIYILNATSLTTALSSPGKNRFLQD